MTRSRPLFFLLVFFYLGFLSTPVSARGKAPRSVVHITSRLLVPTYHYQYSTAQIQAMSGIQAPSRAAEEPGLTIFEYELTSKYEMEVNGSSPGGPFWVWAKSLQASFITRRMDLYVSSQYPRGTCQFRAIMNHENNHVAINKRVFRKYLKLLNRRLKTTVSIPTQARPLRAASELEGENMLDARIKPLVTKLEEQFGAEIKRENAKIDTPESY